LLHPVREHLVLIEDPTQAGAAPVGEALPRLDPAHDLAAGVAQPPPGNGLGHTPTASTSTAGIPMVPPHAGEAGEDRRAVRRSSARRAGCSGPSSPSAAPAPPCAARSPGRTGAVRATAAPRSARARPAPPPASRTGRRTPLDPRLRSCRSAP